MWSLHLLLPHDEVTPMRRLVTLILLLPMFAALPAHATVFATVRGVVHDPQHRPVAGAHVLLNAANSAFSLHSETGNDGEFAIPEAPIGLYTLNIEATGFETFTEPLSLASGTNPVVHVALSVGSATV